MLARHASGLAILALLCMQATSFGQQAFWHSDLESAKRAAAQSNRLVLVHFSAPWCAPCARLEENVFKKPGFSAALDPQFVGVKLNLDNNQKLAAQYGVQAIPADVIMTPHGQVVQRLQSPPTIENYVAVMQQVAARAGKSAAMLASMSQTPATGQPAVSPGTPPAAASAKLSDDRYADYFSQLRGSQPPGQPQTSPAQVASAQPPMTGAAAAQGYLAQPAQAGQSMPNQPAAANQQMAMAQQPATAPAMPPGSYNAAAASAPNVSPAIAQHYPQQQPAAQSPSAGAAPAMQAAALPPARRVQLPPGSPPLGFEGYCPVTLVEKKQWKTGDVRYGAIHRGRTYLFVSPAEQQRFLANPDAFSPVMSGDDPVMAMDQNRSVPGTRKHGVFFGERIYLFSSEATLATFSKNPARYAPEITQARR